MQNENRKHVSNDGVKKQHRHNRRVVIKYKLIAISVLCLFAFIFLSTAAASKTKARLIVAANSHKIYQEGMLPEGEGAVTVSVIGDADALLDKSTGYSVKDLVADLRAGKGVELKYPEDWTSEGTYPIEIVFTDKMEQRLQKDWMGKISAVTEDGVLTIENKDGVWEEERFKRYDGSYAAEEFVVSQGNTYYFDKDGNKVTGEQQIGSYLCKFDDVGKMLSKELRVDPTKPMIALTFDDGPGGRTMELLQALEKNGARATFFMLGANVEAYADTVKKMGKIGCELGNHSFGHKNLTKLDAAGINQEMGSTNTAISNAAGRPATVMRPPYGEANEAVNASVGMPLIFWSMDTLDWKTKNVQATIDTVLGQAQDGDIVLLHDIHTTTIDAVIQLIPELTKRGFQLVTVSEMATAKGNPLGNGVQYRSFKAL